MIRERFSGLPVTALTATATGRVQADVKRSLGMTDCACFQVSSQPCQHVSAGMYERFPHGFGSSHERVSLRARAARPHATQHCMHVLRVGLEVVVARLQ